MILLPLILAGTAAAAPSVASTVYRDCVVSKAQQWASGSDDAQVIVKTAEGMCEKERQAMSMAFFTFADSRKDPATASGVTPDTVRKFVEGSTDGVVEATRTVAFSAVLEARSKKTP